MTGPVLQPGDQIVLAMPINPALHGQALDDEAKRTNDVQVAFYKSYGVYVAQTICCSTLSHPVVVAIFRRSSE